MPLQFSLWSPVKRWGKIIFGMTSSLPPLPQNCPSDDFWSDLPGTIWLGKGPCSVSEIHFLHLSKYIYWCSFPEDFAK